MTKLSFLSCRVSTTVLIVFPTKDHGFIEDRLTVPIAMIYNQEHRRYVNVANVITGDDPVWVIPNLARFE